MACFALALFAFFIGWFAVPELARLLLERRKKYRLSDSGAILYPSSSTTMPRPFAAPLIACRFLCGTGLACMAALCWNFMEPLPCSLALSGFALMETACVCDLKARIIPWELCLVMLMLAIPFRLATGSVEELVASVALALLLLFLFEACNLVSRRLHSSTAIGLGDLRMIPALCMFGGLEGTLVGMFSCSALMGAYAVLALAMKWATPRSGIPFAPGLAVWFVVGVFASALL